MKKRLLIFSILLLVLTITLLTSCNKKPKNTNDILTFLKNMESYTTDMNMDIKNDKQTINYNAKQSYLRGGGYKLELNNSRVFIYKTDDNIYIRDKNNGTNYVQSKDFDEVLKLSFIGEYIGLLYTNEEIKYAVKKIVFSSSATVYGDNKSPFVESIAALDKLVRPLAV